MDDTKSIPLFQMVDAVQFYVPDIDAGVRYYGDILWHEIIWKTELAVGLHMPGSETEIVIQNERDYQEIDLSVESADAAARRIEDAGSCRPSTSKLAEPSSSRTRGATAWFCCAPARGTLSLTPTAS